MKTDVEGRLPRPWSSLRPPARLAGTATRNGQAGILADVELEGRTLRIHRPLSPDVTVALGEVHRVFGPVEILALEEPS